MRDRITEPEVSTAVSALDALYREMERDRCRAIMTSPLVELRERFARHLTFETDLSAAEAIGILRGAPIDPPAVDDEDDR